MKSTIHLLVTLFGESAAVEVVRLAEPFSTYEGEILVEGRSFGDVIKVIEAAAYESQGRSAEEMQADHEAAARSAHADRPPYTGPPSSPELTAAADDWIRRWLDDGPLPHYLALDTLEKAIGRARAAR